MMGVEHGGFIVASYAAAAVTVAGLILRAWLAHRSATRQLAALEAQGVRRRSEAIES